MATIYILFSLFGLRKSSDSGDMNDLVDLMTQTLHMEKDRGQLSLGPRDEFRIHRKYRDTLMLHGRADEGQADVFFQDIPSGMESISPS